MSMDNQLFEFMRDRFDAIDAKLSEAATSFNSHAEADAKYWKIIDGQQAQLSLMKRVFWGAVTIAGTIGGWLGFHR